MKRLLDLFCGAGGAAVGYHRAGFEVVGVDIKPQKHYPFEFHQADALEYLAEHGWKFDVIHASPPCQRFSVGVPPHIRQRYPDVIAEVRAALVGIGKPYTIENVRHAPLIGATTMLCGSMFGPRSAMGTVLQRHRYFEAPWLTCLTPTCRHSPGRTVTVTGNGTTSGNRQTLGRNVSTAEMREVMGIDWMNRDELSEAVPPAYTEWIGKQLIRALCDVSVASTPSA
jgi:DNA (cytosine-5)-methyltransferase 1